MEKMSLNSLVVSIPTPRTWSSELDHRALKKKWSLWAHWWAQVVNSVFLPVCQILFHRYHRTWSQFLWCPCHSGLDQFCWQKQDLQYTFILYIVQIYTLFSLPYQKPYKSSVISKNVLPPRRVRKTLQRAFWLCDLFYPRVRRKERESPHLLWAPRCNPSVLYVPWPRKIPYSHDT